jgi:Protein of unknown function (DUF4235)
MYGVFEPPSVLLGKLSRMRRRSPATDSAVRDAPAQPGVPLAARLLYAPMGLVARRLAPRLSARLFERIWARVDGGEPPPRPSDRQRSVGRLALALALEGALTAIVRGLMDHASRRQFARLTGRWPSRSSK